MEVGLSLEQKRHEVMTLRRPHRHWAFAVAFIAVLIFASVVVHDDVILTVLLYTCIWAGAALAWNILAGFGGQLSFGHAAFFGTGAYTMGILYVKMGVSPWIGMLAGGVIAALLAIAIGFVTFPLRGPYFSLATLALAEVVRLVVIYKADLTGGSAGLPMSIDTGLVNMFWFDTRPFVWLSIGYMSIVWGVSAWIRGSRFGYFLRAIRDDEEAAMAAGVNPILVKMGAAVISGFFTAIGGALLARYLTLASPDQALSVQVSLQLMVMTILGGLGTLAGPVIGAFITNPMMEFLRIHVGFTNAGNLYQLIYGALFVLVILVLPQGIGPPIAHRSAQLWRRLRRREP